MIAVADTSPLCYLILIDEVDVLPKLFCKVVVPAAVISELLHEDAPKAVRGGRPISRHGLLSRRIQFAAQQAWRNFRPVSRPRFC